MARESTIPSVTVREDIRALEEFPAFGTTPGIIKVMVGRVQLVKKTADAAGRLLKEEDQQEVYEFITPQHFQVYTIEGAMYDELCGPATDWAPDKPEGTYRNEDLWHFIDLIRNA